MVKKIDSAILQKRAEDRKALKEDKVLLDGIRQELLMLGVPDERIKELIRNLPRLSARKHRIIEVHLDPETNVASLKLVTPVSRAEKKEEEFLYAEEKARRSTLRNMMILAARKSFYVYVQLMGPLLVPGFKDGIHIKIICDALQESYETPNSRLMVFLPPGSSKSVLGSLLFPSWVFGKEPTWQILHIAHTADFVGIFGGKIRDILRMEEYKSIFPDTVLNDNFGARNHWETTKQGVYRCAGVGGAIAGKRGHIGICGLDTNYVLGSNGKPIRLRDLKVGTGILGPDGVEVVTNKVDRRHKVCYTVDNEVEVSPEHPFFDYDKREWVEAKDLIVNQTRLQVGDNLWTRIVKKCTKFGVVLNAARGFSLMEKTLKRIFGIQKKV